MTDRMQKMPSTAELPMAKSPLTKTASEKEGLKIQQNINKILFHF